MNRLDSSDWLEYPAGGSAARRHDAVIWSLDSDLKEVAGVKYVKKRKLLYL